MKCKRTRIVNNTVHGSYTIRIQGYRIWITNIGSRDIVTVRERGTRPVIGIRPKWISARAGPGYWA